MALVVSSRRTPRAQTSHSTARTLRDVLARHASAPTADRPSAPLANPAEIPDTNLFVPEGRIRMRIAYLDCFSGCAGDMFLAALIDAGVPLAELQRVVNLLQLPGVSLHLERVKRGGIAAAHVRVEVGPESRKAHRHLHHIVKIIDAAALPPGVGNRAKAVFTKLAEAEAAVHGSTIEKVHFHEVGAADAIVDIVCACAGLAHLGIERLHCSPVPPGSGAVHCEHGIMPVPAPATARLLADIPLAACEEPGELVTPTGAALIATLAAAFGPLPAMKISAQGWGAGTREGKTRANVLRLIVGDASDPAPSHGDVEFDTVTVLEAQLDDAPGQVVAFAIERLLAAGALDAYAVPIMMKKGRPGILLTVLVKPEDRLRAEDVLFAQTPTLGVRRTTCDRTKLARRHDTVATPFGEIRVKVGRRNGRDAQIWPEYEDCAAAALRCNVALRDVQLEALRSWKNADCGSD